MAINHPELFMLASYASPQPPFQRFCWFSEGSAASPGCVERGSALSSLVFVDKLEEEDSGRAGTQLYVNVNKKCKCRSDRNVIITAEASMLHS